MVNNILVCGFIIIHWLPIPQKLLFSTPKNDLEEDSSLMVFPVLQVWRVQSLDVLLVELDESQVHQHFFLTIWPCKWFYFTNETREIEKSHLFKVNILIIKVLHRTYLMCDHVRSIHNKLLDRLLAPHPDLEETESTHCHSSRCATVSENCHLLKTGKIFGRVKGG